MGGPGVIPGWKVKRELLRLRDFGWSILGHAYEPIQKARHDRWRKALPVPADEAVVAAGKIAVVLVYQPRAIPDSLLLTLGYLVENGYAPLVVSNTPLDRTARESLHPVVWRIVERPNIGYDFGGYRDGVLLLRQWGVTVARLIVMNDSIWMPLAPGSTLIARLEAAEADVVGGIEHPDVRRRSGSVRAGFIESYLYLFNRSAWDHPAFLRFWQGYRMSSNKLNAIYRGERGLSQALRKAGLRVTGLFSAERLLAELGAAGPEALVQTLVHAAYLEPDLQAERDALLIADRGAEDWCEKALDHIRQTSERRRFNASFPWPSIGLMGVDFLKKSAGPTTSVALSLHSGARRQYLAAVRLGILPQPFADVEKEIVAVEQQDPPSDSGGH
jgi:hypothetical protein